jgi:hypothetical protein
MAHPIKLVRATALVLAVLMLCTHTLVPAARAAMVTTGEALGASAAPDSRARLLALIDRADIQREMTALGVDPAEARARAEALSDEELAQVAGRLEALPAGGSSLGVVLGIGLVVFLVLLVTDILGYTRVFPFVRHPR